MATEGFVSGQIEKIQKTAHETESELEKGGYIALKQTPESEKYQEPPLFQNEKPTPMPRGVLTEILSERTRTLLENYRMEPVGFGCILRVGLTHGIALAHFVTWKL